MNLKKPYTIDEQVDRLLAHNMAIGDIEAAKQVLSHTNYYRLSGYGLQFRDPHTADDYISGTDFETILQILLLMPVVYII